MRLPKSVRVGDTTYTVEAVRGLKDDEGNDAHGTFDASACLLSIESSDSDERQRWALVHEISHAAFHESDMSGDLKDLLGERRASEIEEGVIRRVVPELLRALKDAKVIR